MKNVDQLCLGEFLPTRQLTGKKYKKKQHFSFSESNSYMASHQGLIQFKNKASALHMLLILLFLMQPKNSFSSALKYLM